MRPDYVKIAALEHELWDGPFDHDECTTCHPFRSPYSALAFFALRPELFAEPGVIGKQARNAKV